MNRLKNFIITAYLLSFITIPSALAQGLNRGEVKLTKPIGGDILPGGNQSLTGDVEGSFIFSKVLPFVITYTVRLAVALAVIALIIGGYQYMTAYGDEEKHKAAQKTITYAIIGLVIAITAFGIVKIITNLKIT